MAELGRFSNPEEKLNPGIPIIYYNDVHCIPTIQILRQQK